MKNEKPIRIVNGYRLIYKPDCKKAMQSENWRGYIYEHIYLSEKFLGRELLNNEEVHHLDGDKLNNRKSNLIVLLKSQHSKLHRWISKGSPYKIKNKIIHHCLVCGNSLQGKQIKYCCQECCRTVSRKVKNRPPIEILLEELEKTPYYKLCKKYNISDNGLRKWVRAYGYNPKTLTKI